MCGRVGECVWARAHRGTDSPRWAPPGTRGLPVCAGSFWSKGLLCSPNPTELKGKSEMSAFRLFLGEKEESTHRIMALGTQNVSWKPQAPELT